MNHRHTLRWCAPCAAALLGLAACHTPPAALRETLPDQTPAEVEVPPAAVVTSIPSPDVAPPCLPPVSQPKTRAKPSVRAPRTASIAPPTSEPPPAMGGAPAVRRTDTPLASVLGRRVSALDGDDLGRIVDVLADHNGRVRAAIIEFGGFLGLGNRRVAVDWALLGVAPGDLDAPVTVKATRRELQAAPDYKESGAPLSILGAGQTTK